MDNSTSSIPLVKEEKKEEEKKEEKKEVSTTSNEKSTTMMMTTTVTPKNLMERPKEQDLNSFTKIEVNRNDPNFKGKWVGIGYKITQISKVDDGSNSYHCEFFLYPTWQDKSLIGKHEKGKKFTFEELPWEPKIKFKNELGYEILMTNCWLADPTTGTIDASIRYRGTFFEHLELQNFPFDKQDLRIFVDSFYHQDNMRFYQRDDRPNSFAAHRFPLSEWSFEEDSCEMRLSTVASGNSYYNYVINCPVRRLHEYYVVNTLCTSAMLLSMGVGTFVFDITSIDNRLNFVVTLALTSVAFKYLMLERLPRVPYSTLLDKFMYALFGLITMLAIFVIIIGAVYDRGVKSNADYINIADQLNTIGLWMYLGLTAVLHIVAIIFLIFRKNLIKDRANT